MFSQPKSLMALRIDDSLLISTQGKWDKTNTAVTAPEAHKVAEQNSSRCKMRIPANYDQVFPQSGPVTRLLLSA